MGEVGGVRGRGPLGVESSIHMRARVGCCRADSETGQGYKVGDSMQFTVKRWVGQALRGLRDARRAWRDSRGGWHGTVHACRVHEAGGLISIDGSLRPEGAVSAKTVHGALDRGSSPTD